MSYVETTNPNMFSLFIYKTFYVYIIIKSPSYMWHITKLRYITHLYLTVYNISLHHYIYNIKVMYS